MIKINHKIKPSDLSSKIQLLWELSGKKIKSIEEGFDPSQGSPVFTVEGKYSTRGWTEWTQGFQYGSQILQFDATGEETFLEAGRRNIVTSMATHVSDFGVHDHGFNNVSTYGNSLRLMNEGRIAPNQWEKDFYELALKISGAVQARRWTRIGSGEGYIYSFNGPHSLFVDTIRSCRSLAYSHRLGHRLDDEDGHPVSLLERLVQHAQATARYSVYYGEDRDIHDIKGRTAHESIFNVSDGSYRCPSTQQGYSPFSTWTRGLAWAMCGFAEHLEFIDTLEDGELESLGGRAEIEGFMLKAASATSDFYIDNTPEDGIPYWDTGAPNLHKLGDYLQQPADPYNDHEPVDSSAAAIGAQGLLRLGRYISSKGGSEAADRYNQAGLTILDTLFDTPYLSTDQEHQGLILHSVYHRPNGWDHIPEGHKIPCGESSMWGDYHAREAALYVQRLITGEPYLTFFG
ncbi:MAG: glycoside hydrolase family 88 protein [Fidelibacterota bacterium]|nr:MAG: glycoside hydrolase family 88 protein [Candidatus Neomarinimicrobiota bacterium]